ncbi:hypothetical protein [Kingella potus]|nr:hypothetical protein [Kingella potus]
MKIPCSKRFQTASRSLRYRLKNAAAGGGKTSCRRHPAEGAF